jgi:hypothetical protein
MQRDGKPAWTGGEGTYRSLEEALNQLKHVLSLNRTGNDTYQLYHVGNPFLKDEEGEEVGI